MNLTARCPACQTSYRVLPDQLRISDGWVRCGQCGEVFDASPQRMVTASEPTAKVPADDPAFDVQQVVVPQARVVDQQSSSVPTADSPVHDEALTARPASEMPWASATLLVRPSVDAGSDADEPAAPTSSPWAAPVSFMSAPDVTVGARQRGRSVLWWGLGAVLLLGLLLQGLYRERDRWAALLPELKPALVSACEVLDCRVSSLQGIENLTTESATFHQVGQDTFELRFVVKNKARHAVALPSIELTLTDLAEQAVMRRIFTPAELGTLLESVGPTGEWSVTAYVRIREEATGARAQGYRLLIFYP